MSTPRPLRSNSFLWYMRIVQAIMAAIVLGITGSNASDWHSWKCSLPSRLSYNIACVRHVLFRCFLSLMCCVTGIRNPTSHHISHYVLWSKALNTSPSLEQMGSARNRRLLPRSLARDYRHLSLQLSKPLRRLSRDRRRQRLQCLGWLALLLVLCER
jgi:hypothetical protein